MRSNVLGIVALLCGASLGGVLASPEAAPGAPLASFPNPCGPGDGRGLARGGDGNLYFTVIASDTRVHVMAPDGTCLGSHAFPLRLYGLTWDGTRGVFWGTAYDVALRDSVALTWDPASGEVAYRFTAARLGGDEGFLRGIAHDPAGDALWVSYRAFGMVQGSRLFHATPGGDVLGDHLLAGDLVGVAWDGAHLWTTFSWPREVQRHAPPAPGETLGEPTIRVPMTEGRFVMDMAYAPDRFTPACALWTLTTGGGTNTVDALEVRCPVEAVADAWTLTVAGTGAGSWPGVAVRQHGRAFAEQGERASVESAGLDLLAARAAGGRSEATTALLRTAWPFASEARASATVAGFEVPGLLRADAVRVSVAASLDTDGAGARVQGVVVGLRIGDGEPVDVRYEGEPVVLPLPGGAGGVVLFARDDAGDGGRASEVRVAGLRVILQGTAGPVALEAAVAWSGVAAGAPLRPHPPAGDWVDACAPPLRGGHAPPACAPERVDAPLPGSLPDAARVTARAAEPR